MGRERQPWREGLQAWDRLVAWWGGQQTDGADALTALSDVGHLRRTLDQAELAAVRAARRAGRSWSEIATELGVTRQSAWERWRDLDEETPAEPATTRAIASAASALRRRATVTVPNVVGMSWDDARHTLQDKRLIAVGSDPDGPPLAAAGWPGGVVTDQSPESGAKVPAGTPVRLWIERGGGSGVREPRRPHPTPRAGRAMRNEPTESIG